MDRVTQLDSRTADLVTRRRGLLGPGLKLFYERPLELVSGRGTSLFDAAGNRFLDAYNNVPSIGHCHPRLIETIRAQASALNTNTRYLSEPILEYAERLLASHSGDLTRVIFTSSGSEAVDVALRIAWHATGRLGLIVTENAYHGVTAATAAISPSLGQGSPIHPYVRTVPPPFAGDGANSRAPDAFAADLSRAVEELGGDGFGVAAIVLDSVFASDGLITEPLGLLKGAQELAHSVGALIITDEVQAGFGRTGEAMWGYQRHGVSPDLVPMGKPMGGGMPVGGVAGRSGLIDAFASDVGFFSTFGGSSVPIAAARTVLEVIEEEGLVDNAGAVGGHLGRGLRTLASQSRIVGEVRGVGLYYMADIIDWHTQPDAGSAKRIVNAMRDRGILISATGPAASTLKIRPPLPFSESDANELLNALADTLAIEDASSSAPTERAPD